MKGPTQVLVTLLTVLLSGSGSSASDATSPAVLRVTVGPQLVDCVGVGPMKCLVVDGLNFYQNIEGFAHEAGVTYVLDIERRQRFDSENAPADAGLYAYRLLTIVSRDPS
ncbi:MAG: DUF4377 domain-containing protein [Rhodobacteraceae bacterium]|nr:DUF4377 domain-containing protein [Paracoccaceae bacterium]